jgi:hypothetical protein
LQLGGHRRRPSALAQSYGHQAFLDCVILIQAVEKNGVAQDMICIKPEDKEEP